MDNSLYDLIIIGAGPAGITAGVYAARQKLNALILTDDIGGQAAWSGDIENYTGFQFISGVELTRIFAEQIKKYPISIKEKELVTSIKQSGSNFEVSSNKGSYLSKAVIIAAGKTSRKLGVPGEAEYRNKGVTYCAVCDGPIFAGKDVAIIGGGNSALDAALQMTKLAKKVYVVNNMPGFTGEAVMADNLVKNAVVEVIHNASVKKIIGEKFVKELVIEQNSKERTLQVSGVFIEIGLIPNSELGISINKNKHNELAVDNKNRTNIPGLFAAGDVTDVPEKQIVVAAGEGAKACLSAVKYLNSLKTETEKERNSMSKWKCLVCGYIYDPAQNGDIPFEKLAEDWTCPECGVGKDQFEKIA